MQKKREVQSRRQGLQGRRVLLMKGLLVNGWARDLAGRDGVEVLDSAAAVVGALEPRRSAAA